MGLKELKSNLDIAGGFGGAPNQTSTQQSTIPGPSVNNAIPDPDYHTKKGTTDSPFHSRGEGSGDHLIDLLEDRIVHSSNTTNIYDPQQMTGLSPGPPTPGGDQDFDGLDQGVIGGPRLFHGINNPQRGQGIQLGGVDLHEHLLTNPYNYTYGNSSQFYNATENVGPSPGQTGNSEYQDLDAVDGGNGYFHGIANPGKYQGKQLGGKDLHETMLTDPYTNNGVTVGPSPGPSGHSEHQDLDAVLPNHASYNAGKGPGDGYY